MTSWYLDVFFCLRYNNWSVRAQASGFEERAMETYLAIIFHRPQSEYAAVGLQILNLGETPNWDTVLPIDEFMSQYGITTSQFRGLFPGYLKGPNDAEGKEQLVYRWFEYPTMCCSLPMGGEELTRFSNLMRLPIIVFTHERGQQPAEATRINC